MRTLSWTTFALTCLGAATTGSSLRGQDVVINEFLYDELGVDANEFVELYNRSASAVDISGWRVQALDASAQKSLFVVPASTVIAPGAYYVLGSALVPNVSQVVGTTDIWENDNEAIVLRDAGGQVQDSVVTEAFRGIDVIGAFAQGEGLWGEYVSDPARPTSLQRARDGYYNADHRDFILRPWTPGATNDLPVITGLRERFDGFSVGQDVPGWSGSRMSPKVIDPTVADAHNPTAIPLSGQRGKAAVFWDSTPGARGNNCMMLSEGATSDVLVECNVYFDAANEPVGEREAWSLGVQGSSDSLGASPDPFQYWSLIENGHTGVAWIYQSTEQGAVLFLVDHNDGGWGLDPRTLPFVHAAIPIRPGFNDGWQRLRLQIIGNRVVGMFGGLPGCRGGTIVNFTISRPALGGVYVSYAEDLTNDATRRPFTCDDLLINIGTDGGLHYFGTSSPNSVTTTPRIDINQFPALGSPNFALLVSGLKPNGIGQLYIATTTLPIPLDLGLIGGQVGANVYMFPDQAASCNANGSGIDTKPAPIPCEALLRDARFYLQVLEVDASLPFTLPVATSQGVQMTIG
ncbi:MAG: lamin tail domain-containing protein [Planctomycetes bacterium]|nr:lamin tail domain-containing protein [Planctomycetota bacterium]